MNRKNIIWVGMVAIMGLCISLAWVACQKIPNEDKSVSVSVSLDLNLPAEATAEATVGPLTAASATSAYHVKITLTNPSETYYVYDYVPGVPVSLLVAAGGSRTLDVEVYRVDNSPSPSYDYVPAVHYIPSHPIRLDLSGASTRVVVDVFQDTNTNYLYSGLQHMVKYGDTTTVQLDPHCPYPYYYAYVNDAFFGLTFPTFPVDLFDGSSPPNQLPLFIDNMLKNRLYFIEIYNDYSGIYQDMAVFTGNTASTNIPPLLFQGFNPARSIVFSPSRINGVTPGDSVQVNFSMMGGWGTIIPFSTYTYYGYDSCGGYEITPGVWQTYPINRTVCVISIYSEDCDYMSAHGSMTVHTSLPPSCSPDEYCDTQAGEDNQSCPADCYCGDGVCFPPWEDEDSCPSDCGGG